jgi:hypothetical protein
MKKILIIVAVLSLSCFKVDLMRDVPDCIEAKIRDFTKIESTCDSGSEVNEYLFQGETVYSFFEGNCGSDSGTQVFDHECNFIGFLGGIANLKEINGEDFDSNAVFIGKVWGN